MTGILVRLIIYSLADDTRRSDISFLDKVLQIISPLQVCCRSRYILLYSGLGNLLDDVSTLCTNESEICQTDEISLSADLYFSK